MNEQNIIAAILTAGLLAQPPAPTQGGGTPVTTLPQRAVALYAQVLAQLRQSHGAGASNQGP